MISELDVAANRKTQKWTKFELAGRLLWVLATPLFAWSPRPLWGWRRLLLRAFGAHIGNHVRIYPNVRIAIPWNLQIDASAAIGDRAILYSLGTIHIGVASTISQGAHLCAGSHDYRDPRMPLLKLPIVVGRGAWVCADAFIGPGVAIGDMAIVGARAVVVKNVAASTIVAGNPAHVIGSR